MTIQPRFWTQLASSWVHQLSAEQKQVVSGAVVATTTEMERQLRELGTLESIRSAQEEILLIADDDDDDFI